ncbi:MAG: metal-sensitive transcriptional regulator [Acidimicrobiales bacterium]
MIEGYKTEALTRLKTVRGHLDGVIDMVQAERYCPELMKQVAALQASLEKVNRLLLRNHLETCVSEAIQTGQGREKIDELMEALRFNSSLTDFRRLADVLDAPVGNGHCSAEVPRAAPEGG